MQSDAIQSHLISCHRCISPQVDSDSDSDVGPPPPPPAAAASESVDPTSTSTPTPISDPDAPPAKKKKKTIASLDPDSVAATRLALSMLPSAAMYERSFMHRDVLSHVVVLPATHFVITASIDGHLKFWKKMVRGQWLVWWERRPREL